ncbi:MAG: PAS domain S-box protein [Bacteroidota bacterium]|nr:PAS domain S-box protein [Bacteroidota bacterium]
MSVGNDEIDFLKNLLAQKDKDISLLNHEINIYKEEIGNLSEKLDSLLESISSFMIRIDMQGFYTFVNKSFCQKFGVKFDKIIGQHFAQTIHPDDLIYCQMAAEALMKDPNSIQTVALRKPNPKGGYFFTEWEFIAIKNIRGEIIEVQAVGHDVTKQRLYEKELIEKEQYARELFHFSPIAKLIISSEGGIIKDVNRMVETILGKEKHKIIGYHINKFFPNLYNQKSNESFVFHEVITAYPEIEFRNRNGEIFYFSISASELTIDNVNHLLVEFTDITSIKKTKKELEITKEMLEQTSKIARVGGWEMNLKNNEILLSDIAKEILEKTEGENATYESAIQMYSVEDQMRINESVQNTIATGIPYDIEITVTTYKGNKKWVRVIGAVEKDKDGVPYRLYGAFYDIDASKRTLLELQRTKALLEQTGRLAKVGGYEMDLKTGKIYLSEVAKEILEKTSNEVSTLQETENMYTPDDLIKLKLALENTIKTGIPYDLEINITTHKGNKKWLRVIGAVEKVNDIPVKIYGAMYDIDDTKKASIELKKTKEMLEQTSRLAKIGGWELDLTTNHLNWSNELKEIMEADSSFIPTFENTFLLYNPDDQILIQAAMQNTLATGQPFEMDLNLNTFKGNNIWARVHTAVEFKNNKPHRLYGVFYDITSSKIANLELQKTKEMLEETSQISKIGGWEFDVINKKANVTKTTLHIIEADENSEIEGQSGLELFCDGSDKENMLSLSGKCMIYGDPFECELQIRTFKGNVKWVHLKGQAEFKENKTIRMFGTIADITDKKLLEEERQKLIKDLTRQNTELMQFSYIVSHNLRAPVANIIGLIDLLKKSKNISLDQIIDMLMVSSINLDHVIYDINEILAIRNKVKEYKQINFNEVMAIIYTMLDKSIVETNTVIETDFSNLKSLKSVSGFIQSIFFNLISNSIKYRKPNESPHIKIKTYVAENNCVIEFDDNGIGIDLNKYKHKIFGLYQRFHVSSHGKGVGLHLVKSNISSLGGEIEVFSELNVGTKFIVKLPIE